jgi:hypothetical protein
MRKRFLMFAVIVTAGCNGLDPFNAGLACTTDVRPGITVTTVDAATGQPVSTRGTVVATEGSFVDTATFFSTPSPTYALAFERAGTYTVTVEVPGYIPFRLDGVVVSKGECHVETVSVTATLSK